MHRLQKAAPMYRIERAVTARALVRLGMARDIRLPFMPTVGIPIALTAAGREWLVNNS